MNPPSVAAMSKALRAAGWRLTVDKNRIDGSFLASAFSRSLDTTAVARGATKRAALWTIYRSNILGE